MLEFVRALKAEFGLGELPPVWPERPDGSLRLDARCVDGLGATGGILEIRQEWGPSWYASLSRSARTGVDLRKARVVSPAAVRERPWGRRFCRKEGTGEFDVVQRCRPCDPAEGSADSCAGACASSGAGS
jgi:hypothetical protein